MRIAYLSTFYPYRGGIAQFNASLYQALLDQGHEVLPYTFSRQYPQVLFPGKTQHVLPGDRAAALNSIAVLDSINPLNWPKAARQIRDRKPDLLLMKYWMSFFGPSLGAVAGRMRAETRVVSVLDNVLPHERRFFDLPLTRRFLQRNDGFVVMSESVEKDLNQFRAEAPRLFHRHPVYDHFGEAMDRAEARRALGLKPDEKLLLFYGFIRAYKGLDLLLDAFDQLSGPYRLMIAGEAYEPFAPYAARIKASPHALAIEVRERYIPDEETRLLFSAADACVLPYHHATQSGIALIAYQFRLPLLATDVGGFKEYITDGVNGILVPPGDKGALARGIARYFEQGGYDHFSPALSKLRQQLSWEHLGKSLTEFVDKLPRRT
ncbi:MAG: glycosyltransferase [Bacteroidetes bacterium]|nr:glycosyltransferase [Bacteroidota bacterium]